MESVSLNKKFRYREGDLVKRYLISNPKVYAVMRIIDRLDYEYFYSEESYEVFVIIDNIPIPEIPSYSYSTNWELANNCMYRSRLLTKREKEELMVELL